MTISSNKVWRLSSVLIVVFALTSCIDKNIDYKRTAYEGSYSFKYQQSTQVCYLLTRSCVCGEVKRTNNFREDSLTKIELLPSYKGSGYDRGHLKPADHSKCSLKEMKSSFSTLNISPQLPEFNRGVWKQLEIYSKNYLNISDSIEVVCGPIFKRKLIRKKANEIPIPDQYYRALKINDTLLIGFILDHQKGDFNPTKTAVSINQLERKLGIDLFKGTAEKHESEVDSVLIQFQQKHSCN